MSNNLAGEEGRSDAEHPKIKYFCYMDFAKNAQHQQTMHIIQLFRISVSVSAVEIKIYILYVKCTPFLAETETVSTCCFDIRSVLHIYMFSGYEIMLGKKGARYTLYTFHYQEQYS